MELGELKPLLKALALPPTGLMLLVLAGVVLGWRRRAAGAALALGGLAALWVLSCNGVAVAMSHWLLPPVVPVAQKDLQGVQAIVVLGGGLQPYAPEYGNAQPGPWALPRLRYAAHLARRSGKPILISAGTGWAAATEVTEAEAYRRMLADDYGITVRWIEDKSRDTRQNAVFSARLVQRDGIRRVAVVTDAVHMPRAVRNFRDAGFDVVPAPTDFILPAASIVDDWLPSARGLRNSTYILHEWLGARLT
jgi:uncharacterized SAM-binding protein YcdF (DUF218 family)